MSSSLTPAKVAALDALADGALVTAAARLAKVTRQTVSLWKNQDSEFRAELDARRTAREKEKAARDYTALNRALWITVSLEELDRVDVLAKQLGTDRRSLARRAVWAGIESICSQPGPDAPQPEQVNAATAPQG
jgi:hypothetical protein